MDRKIGPYLGTCRFCQAGLLRVLRCEDCGTIVAVCDECELLWSDIRAMRANPKQRSDGTFPICPTSHTAASHWQRLNLTAIRRAGLGKYVVGFAPW